MKAPELQLNVLEMFRQHVQGSTELAGFVYSVNHKKKKKKWPPMSHFFSVPFPATLLIN